MASVFPRRLAVPLWVIAFFTVAVTAPPTATLFLMPPTTVFATAAIGIAGMVFLMPGRVPWLRMSRTPVRVVPSGTARTSAAITIAAGTGVGMLDGPNRSTADALDLLRMDDDGGWQRARPPASLPARRMVREPDDRPFLLTAFLPADFHADGVQCGTDKHAPACHPIDPAKHQESA
jgi:hypothetical protein